MIRYIQRDENGNLTGHYANPNLLAQEEVEDDHPDIVAWQEARSVRGPSSGEREAAMLDRIATLEARLAVLEGVKA